MPRSRMLRGGHDATQHSAQGRATAAGHYYDLCHLAGTLTSEGGVPPKRAQEILGHANLRTTVASYTTR